MWRRSSYTDHEMSERNLYTGLSTNHFVLYELNAIFIISSSSSESAVLGMFCASPATPVSRSGLPDDVRGLCLQLSRIRKLRVIAVRVRPSRGWRSCQLSNMLRSTVVWPIINRHPRKTTPAKQEFIFKPASKITPGANYLCDDCTFNMPQKSSYCLYRNISRNRLQECTKVRLVPCHRQYSVVTFPSNVKIMEEHEVKRM